MLSITNLNTNKSTSLQSNSLIMIKGGTWDDYWNLSHEDLKVEYIDEVIYIHSPASLIHEKIFRKLMVALTQHLQKIGMEKAEILGSRFPIKLIDGKRAEPDLMYLSGDDISEGNLTNTLFEGSPSLIIEIVSPDYRSHDTQTKLQKYLDLNVNEYWIVDPELKEVRVVSIENNQIIDDNLLTKGMIESQLKELQGFEIDIEGL